MTSRWLAIGFSTRIGSASHPASARSQSALDEAEGDDLLVVAGGEPRAERGARDGHPRARAASPAAAPAARPGCCRSRRGARPPRRSPPRSRGRSETTAACTTKSAPSRCGAAAAGAKMSAIVVGRDGDAEQPRDARAAHAHRVAPRQLRRARRPAARRAPPQISMISCVARSTAARALAKSTPRSKRYPASVANPSRRPLPWITGGVPERAFEKHVARGVGDAAVLAAHDAGEPERLLLVGDEQQVGLEAERLAVEQRQLLPAFARSARRCRLRAARSS